MPAVLFDFDGVVIDSEMMAWSHWHAALQARGIEIIPSDFAPMFGIAAADVAVRWNEQLLRWFETEDEAKFVDREVWRAASVSEAALPLMDGVAESLDLFSTHGWRIALATGASRARIDKNLERLAIRDYFDAVVTREDVQRGKPFPDLFLEAARRVGLPPDECVVVEDSIHGCEAALAAGMAVLVLPSEIHAACEWPPGATVGTSLLDFTRRTVTARVQSGTSP